MLLLRLAADRLLAGDFAQGRDRLFHVLLVGRPQLPTPMLTTIFSSFGNESRLSRPSFSWQLRARSPLRTSFLQTWSRRRAACFSADFSFFLAMVSYSRRNVGYFLPDFVVLAGLGFASCCCRVGLLRRGDLADARAALLAKPFLAAVRRGSERPAASRLPHDVQKYFTVRKLDRHFLAQHAALRILLAAADVLLTRGSRLRRSPCRSRDRP